MDTGRLQALVHQSHGMGEGVMGTHHLNTQHISSLGEPLCISQEGDRHPPAQYPAHQLPR